MSKSSYHFNSPFMFFLVILLPFFLLGCRVASKSGSIPQSESQNIKNVSILTENEQWMNFINSQIDSLQELYMDNAVAVDTQGKVTQGKIAIIDKRRNDSLHIDSISTITNVFANKNKTYEYEIGTFWASDKKEYKHLIIWNTKDKQKKRELEFIAESKKSTTDLTQINDRRDKWIELCNHHDAEKLVEELYTENAVYYNHKPVITGRDAISKEYQYMNKKTYTLSLSPILVENVSETLAFEIGQCSGTYQGKYILVWQKDNSGEWRILMDSNI